VAFLACAETVPTARTYFCSDNAVRGESSLLAFDASLVLDEAFALNICELFAEGRGGGGRALGSGAPGSLVEAKGR